MGVQANELRIGNWVQIDDLPPEQITLDVFATLKQVPATISKFNPINLTPEILEKAGFESVRWCKGGYNYIHKESRVSFKRLKTQNDAVRFMYHHRILIITTVHQLQNLYFALSGEELNIDL